jgi:hypothetical protein
MADNVVRLDEVRDRATLIGLGLIERDGKGGYRQTTMGALVKCYFGNGLREGERMTEKGVRALREHLARHGLDLDEIANGAA